MRRQTHKYKKWPKAILCTPSAIKVDRSHIDVDQLLALLRFKPREKRAEMIWIIGYNPVVAHCERIR